MAWITILERAYALGASTQMKDRNNDMLTGRFKLSAYCQ